MSNSKISILLGKKKKIVCENFPKNESLKIKINLFQNKKSRLKEKKNPKQNPFSLFVFFFLFPEGNGIN